MLPMLLLRGTTWIHVSAAQRNQQPAKRADKQIPPHLKRLRVIKSFYDSLTERYSRELYVSPLEYEILVYVRIAFLATLGEN